MGRKPIIWPLVWHQGRFTKPYTVQAIQDTFAACSYVRHSGYCSNSIVFFSTSKTFITQFYLLHFIYIHTCYIEMLQPWPNNQCMWLMSGHHVIKSQDQWHWESYCSYSTILWRQTANCQPCDSHANQSRCAMVMVDHPDWSMWLSHGRRFILVPCKIAKIPSTVHWGGTTEMQNKSINTVLPPKSSKPLPLLLWGEVMEISQECRENPRHQGEVVITNPYKLHQLRQRSEMGCERG